MSDTPLPVQPARGRRARAVALALLAAGLIAPAVFWTARHTTAADTPKGPAAAGSTTVGGVPLFATWPKDRKPEVVLVLTGQTMGHTSPCGCSRPQKGGLERRANFLDGLRAKGWPVVPLDVGDIAPPRKVPEQDLLKYKFTMDALREMGYAAVGLGEKDFEQQLWELLARYPLQHPDTPPIILCANLVGLDNNKQPIPREKQFAGAGKRPMVDDVEVVTKDAKVGDHMPVGVAGVIGKGLYEKIQKIDPQFAFLANPQLLPALAAKLKGRTQGTGINVLLYGGAKEEAMEVAKGVPDFHVILCQSDDPEPPQFPALANDGKTFVVQVGHKGQNLGVVGVFKGANGGYELKYQLVPLGEEFMTPFDPQAEKANKVLQILEQYRAEVKKQNLLAKFTERPLPHPAQIQNPQANLSFVSSERCAACHPAEFKVWKDSKHSHALDTLEHLPPHSRPGLANFDGECLQCHTIGFGYQTGFRNTTDTPLLKHVGCESCHGPGSGHAANPADKKLLAALSPWKTQPTDKLPDRETLLKLSAVKPGDPPPVRLEAKQQQFLTAVRANCMKCHDLENDPKFELEKYMPQIWHSGFRQGTAGLPPNAK